MKTKWLMSVRKRLPTLMVVSSALTGAAALYFTGRATVKAVRTYDEMKKNGEAITPKIVIKKIVPYYIPAIGFAATSLSFSIAGNTVQAKRNRALSLVSSSAVEALNEFKDKAKDILGEEQVEKIEEAQAFEAPVIASKVGLDDPITVYDVDTNVKFQTTYKLLYESEAMVNEQLSSSEWSKGWTTIKQFYRYLGVPEKEIEHYPFIDMLWDGEKMILDKQTNWVEFTHEEAYDKEGNMLIMLRYDPKPKYDYDLYCD